jgi:hypothetical protein
MNATSVVFGRHRHGYIFPAVLKVTRQDHSFAGIIQRVETEDNFIMFSSHRLTVTAASRESMVMMGVRQTTLQSFRSVHTHTHTHTHTRARAHTHARADTHTSARTHRTRCTSHITGLRVRASSHSGVVARSARALHSAAVACVAAQVEPSDIDDDLVNLGEFFDASVVEACIREQAAIDEELLQLGTSDDVDAAAARHRLRQRRFRRVEVRRRYCRAATVSLQR